jgi:serine/threonine protein kinase
MRTPQVRQYFPSVNHVVLGGLPMPAPRSPRPSPDTPGHPLAGRYAVGERLGSGGAADVLRAVDLTLGRPVAVKLFRPGGDPELEAGFAEEAELLARLQHPGLVTVYDAGVHGGRAFLVMQLVEGPTLRRRLQEEPLTLPATQRIGARLSHALAHVHAAGIVHRDMKPSNILLDEDGMPHLTDFGIARLTDATTRTRSGTFTGTAAYMSPEQVRGDRPGPESDVYALGLVLLECLTGEIEYAGTALESAVARLHRAPAIPADLPAELRELLAAMTSSRPSERPDAATCAGVLATGRPAVGVLPRRPPKRRSPQRSVSVRVPLAILAALAAVLGAGLALTAFQPGAPSPERRQPSTSPASKPDASADEAEDTKKKPSVTSPSPRHPAPDASGADVHRPVREAPQKPTGAGPPDHGRHHGPPPPGGDRGKGRAHHHPGTEHAGHGPPPGGPVRRH